MSTHHFQVHGNPSLHHNVPERERVVHSLGVRQVKVVEPSLVFNDHHSLQFVNTVNNIVLVVVGCRYLGQSERLPHVTDVEVDLSVIRPLCKDVGTTQSEAVMGAEGGVKLGVDGVGRVSYEEVNCHFGVVRFKGRVVYS